MKIVKGKNTYEGFIDIDGQIACEKCKTINPLCKRGMHMDCTDKFINTYQCEKCGNQMSVITKRSKEDLAYWK